ncbi:MAG: alpha/beta hydrolase, partial [Xanthomonadales bacterium]|nr:alpha/beta hydrolase [Xanthomonadales bacterium]
MLSLVLASCGNDASTTAPQSPSSGAPDFEEGYVPGPDGVELYYRKRGNEGRTLIVPSRLFNWDELEFLGDHFTYISYDMRNRGRSSKVSDGTLLTLEKDVEDLEAVRRHFGIEWFSTIGYSYLGKVVVMYAREHPVRIDRIVQVGPVPPVFATEYPEELTAASLPSPFPEGEVERLGALRD